ncbi:MAG: hypothetical protein ACPGVZ_22180 [Myxococcota bacterium]
MSHPERGPGVPHPYSHRPDHEGASAPDATPVDTTATEGDEHLAGFSLLADPGTIAADAEAPPADTLEEVERLRTALHLRSQEIEALQSKQAPSEATPSPTSDAEAPPTTEDQRSPLLDAASARKLAADARKRERKSRAALEATQKALGVERDATEPDTSMKPPETGSRWEQRALVSSDASPPSPAHRLEPAASTVEAPANATPRTGLDPEDTIRALGRELRLARAENRERDSMIALARETTRRQREEIEALRAQLAEREDERTADLDAPIPPVSPAAGTETTVRALDRDDSIALAARVTALEAELAERDAEHARLDTALAETRARDTQRREKIDLLEDRLAAQDDALDAARREYELERRRHTRSRGIVTRLRTTLSAAAPEESLSEDAGPIAEPERPTLRDEAGSAAESGDDATPARHEVALRIGHAPPAKAIALPERSLDARRAETRIFDAWLDDQVRRHFGPMGIDRLSDLLANPIARRTSASDERATVLLLGPDAWLRAAALAEDLVTSTEDVQIHVADPRSRPEDLGLDPDSPLRDLLVPTDAPKQPSELATLLDTLRPTLVVSHGHLSNESAPEDWLEVLESATQRRTALCFVEATGTPVIEAMDDVRTVGDRIWSLLPERYAQHEGEVLASWSAAFSRGKPGCANDLFEHLRTRFRPELSARFGFLIAPFLHAGIAANFDLEAPRDRRFLAQVADLDERRIEAGEAPALHAVTLVDPLAES